MSQDRTSDQRERGLSKQQMQEALDAGLPSLSSRGITIGSSGDSVLIYQGRRFTPESFPEALQRLDGVMRFALMSANNPDRDDS